MKEVERGVALLDEVRPGWENEIDLGTLSLSSANSCVLGQLYGDYLDGCECIQDGHKSFSGFDYGFNSHSGFGDLQKEWERVIRSRQTVLAEEFELATAGD